MKDGRADAGAAAAGCRGRLRGLPERRAAGRRSRFPARAGGARLRASARPRGATRLLALAVPLPRRRRHLPAGRQGRRDLRRRRPPHRSDRPAARPRRRLTSFSSLPLRLWRWLGRLDEWQTRDLGLALEVDVSRHDRHGAPRTLPNDLDGGSNEAIVTVSRVEPAKGLVHPRLRREYPKRTQRLTKRHARSELPSYAVALDSRD